MSALALQALGTHWWIETFDKNFLAADKLILADYVRNFEAAYSRFRDDSLVDILNTTKFLANPPEEMINMFEYARTMYRRTDKIFNITVGARLEQIGYGKTSDPSAHISDDIDKDITISAEGIRLAKHIRIDFGGFGKGWLIDRIGDELQKLGYGSFMINGGGDILVHAGLGKAQEIIIEHPMDPSLGIGTAILRNGAIAASSARKRSWMTRTGLHKHHIINPMTGESDSKAASLHVAAVTALLADTLSTVMLLSGADHRQRLATDFQTPYLVIDDELRFTMSPGFPGKMYA